jgi:hypothetical protein
MQTDERSAAEANRLYWDSDTPIAEIADRLDLSRRALYDAVEPQPAGAPCIRCGGEMQYANRSARRAGYATCAECGAEDMVDTVETEVMQASPQLGVIEGERGTAERIDMRSPDLRHRAMVIGGAAIAGVAIGSVAAWLATRGD